MAFLYLLVQEVFFCLLLMQASKFTREQAVFPARLYNLAST
jgi:hypothetical protein